MNNKNFQNFNLYTVKVGNIYISRKNLRKNKPRTIVYGSFIWYIMDKVNE